MFCGLQAKSGGSTALHTSSHGTVEQKHTHPNLFSFYIYIIVIITLSSLFAYIYIYIETHTYVCLYYIYMYSCCYFVFKVLPLHRRQDSVCCRQRVYTYCYFCVVVQSRVDSTASGALLRLRPCVASSVSYQQQQQQHHHRHRPPDRGTYCTMDLHGSTR
jgi:hypothetical protein